MVSHFPSSAHGLAVWARSPKPKSPTLAQCGRLRCKHVTKRERRYDMV